MDQYTTSPSSDLLGPPAGEKSASTSNELPTILQAIQTWQATVEMKIGEVRMDTALVRQDLRNATARIERRLSHVHHGEDARALMPRPPPGAQPTPIIIHILNYRDRDAILQGVRRKADL
ncbi:hypothetical protein NDU88_003669 [Pleurodeles waltl]|uniref:Uncharacterized protein n=1 Tax=Pleurodeles waltl TaxID=8319 RepID=A0AAV7NRI2_PLEWA|nr:hypothetical protein NDU88_003669 [Pleurodeles waltl]